VKSYANCEIIDL